MTDKSRPNFDLIIMGDLCPYDRERNNKLVIGSGLAVVLKNCPLIAVNLECPLTLAERGIAKTGPSLKADPAEAGLLARLRLNICDLANNHIKDYGMTGICDTCATLDRLNIGHFGLTGECGHQHLILTVNGARIGMLGFTENEFSTNGSDSVAALGLDPYRQFRQLSELKKLCDHIIVQYHGGVEMYPYPTPGQQRYCRFLIDAGADMVICHHSHTISGSETYAGRKIFYGLGNFYFPEEGNKEDWYLGQGIGIKISDQLEYAAFQTRYNIDEDILEIDKDTATQLKLAALDQVINNDSLLKEAWTEFCISNQDRTLMSIFKPAKLYRLLCKLGMFRKMLRNKADLSLLNFLRCESHREKVLCTLEKVIEQRHVGRNS